jgi:hypothetical protein
MTFSRYFDFFASSEAEERNSNYVSAYEVLGPVLSTYIHHFVQ